MGAPPDKTLLYWGIEKIEDVASGIVDVHRFIERCQTARPVLLNQAEKIRRELSELAKAMASIALEMP